MQSAALKTVWLEPFSTVRNMASTSAFEFLECPLPGRNLAAVQESVEKVNTGLPNGDGLGLSWGKSWVASEDCLVLGPEINKQFQAPSSQCWKGFLSSHVPAMLL